MQSGRGLFTFPRYINYGPASSSGRLYSLLSLVKQEKRMVRKSDVFNVADRLKEEVDYKVVHGELDKLRQFTWNWLEKALKERKIL